MSDEVSFRSMNQWLRAATSCGIDLVSLLREQSLAEKLMHPERATIPRTTLRHLMKRCIDAGMSAQPSRYFPVALGRSARFEYLSDLEVVVSTAPTLRDLLPVLDLFPTFYDVTVRWGVTELGSQARLTMSHTDVDDSDELFGPFVEQFFLAVALTCHQWLGAPLVLARIKFRHQPHAGSEQLAAAFSAGVPIAYGEEINAICFDRRLLDRPLRSALPLVHSAARERLNAMAQEMTLRQVGNDTGGLAGRLETLLMQNPDWLGKKQVDVAGDLGLHVRALQRQLKAEGVTYAQVVNDVKLKMAKRWLKSSDLPISDVGKRLGYLSRSAFAEAFVRQVGVPPSAYRAARNQAEFD